MNRSTLLVAIPPLLSVLAACGEGEAGPANFRAESPEASVVVDRVSPGDCDDALPEPEAVATRVRNWRLQYAQHCPAVDAAIDNCSRLQGVSAQEKQRCLDENIDLAESCPDVAREALRGIVGEGRRADRCRAASRTAVDGILAAHAETLAPHLLADVRRLCHRKQPPAAAERCAAETTGLAVAAAKAVEEAVAPHGDTLTDLHVADIVETCHEFALTTVEEARGCAARVAGVYASDVKQEAAFLAAAKDALAARVPPEHVDRLAAACVEPAFMGSEEPAACGARLGDAQRRILDALGELPADQHGRTVARCLHQPGVVDRDLRLPDPACVASEAAHYAALHAPAAGYSAAERDRCPLSAYRTWSAVHDCVREAWLTDERVAAAKAEAVPAAAARIEPAFARPAAAARCSYAIHRIGILHRLDFLPGEHPRDLVRRHAAECVEREAAGFRILASLAGDRHAGAPEHCAEHILGWEGRRDWADAAGCLAGRAEEQGDQALADLVRRCRPWYSDKAAEEFPACAGVAP